MSLEATLPSGAVSRTVSPSSSSIASKSALPTPTMMIDNGRLEAETMAYEKKTINERFICTFTALKKTFVIVLTISTSSGKNKE